MDPIQIQAGDVIRTRCQYSSVNRTRTTFNTNGAPGESEQCLAFLRFHHHHHSSSSSGSALSGDPPAFPSCVSWGSLLACDAATERGCSARAREKFRGQNLPMTRSYREVTGRCRALGPCTRECKEAVSAARAREACMAHADSWARVRDTVLAHSLFGRHFLSALASCQLDLYRDHAAAAGGGGGGGTGGAAIVEGRGEEGEEARGTGRGQGELSKPPLTISRRRLSCSGCESRVHHAWVATAGTALLTVAVAVNRPLPFF